MSDQRPAGSERLENVAAGSAAMGTGGAGDHQADPGRGDVSRDDDPLKTRASFVGWLVSGDNEAWREFENRYIPLITSWCRKYSPRDVDEMVQAVRVHLISAFKKGKLVYDPQKRFRGLLWTTTKRLMLDLSKAERRRYDLRLMCSPNDASDIQTEGGNRKELIIVTAVNDVLHFHIFNRKGKEVVHTDEEKLAVPARQIEDLRKQLAGSWPPHELTRREKARITSAVTSILDDSRPRKGMRRPSGGTIVLELLRQAPAREDLKKRLAETFDLELLSKAFERVRRRVKPRTWTAFVETALNRRDPAEVAHELGMRVGTVFQAKSSVIEKLVEEISRLERSGANKPR